MGLDITAYSKLRHIGEHEFNPDLNEGEKGPWCYYEGHVQAGAYGAFPQSFRGIPLLVSPVPAAFPLWGGCYEITDETVTHRFRAGSYGGYNRWRQELAQQFNPFPGYDEGEPDPERPFYELIWFADNEGCIGSEAAADLLADFREHRDAYIAEHAADPYPYFREAYDDWTKAFELAADGGLVDFH